MQTLTVFYDGKCGLCHPCRQWLSKQPKYLELRFLAYQSPEAKAILADLPVEDPSKRIVVLSDEGGVYTGDDAWIMCLYALIEYRHWAMRLAHPMLRPFAKTLCERVSHNRLLLSRLFPKPG